MPTVFVFVTQYFVEHIKNPMGWQLTLPALADWLDFRYETKDQHLAANDAFVTLINGIGLALHGQMINKPGEDADERFEQYASLSSQEQDRVRQEVNESRANAGMPPVGNRHQQAPPPQPLQQKRNYAQNFAPNNNPMNQNRIPQAAMVQANESPNGNNGTLAEAYRSGQGPQQQWIREVDAAVAEAVARDSYVVTEADINDGKGSKFA